MVVSVTQPVPIVYVIDDDDAVRDVLRWLIESVGLQVESFARAANFLEAYQPARPGCMLLDIRMPGLSGFDLQEELANRQISIPIIVITGYAEVAMAVRALKAGAFDFVEKPFNHQILLDRVRAAIEVDQKAHQTRLQRAEGAARLARLTPRQREVLDLLMAGKPSKAIATELGLSRKTVDVHRAQIMGRMEAESLAHLFRLVTSAYDASVQTPAPLHAAARAPAPRTSSRPKANHS